MEEQIQKILDDHCDWTPKRIEGLKKELLNLFSVSERYILVEWLNGKPMIDGSTYFDTKEECLEYYNNLPKLTEYDIEYTICRIRNAR